MSPVTVKVERWRPPKPLVGIRAIEKMLNRHTAVSCPESRLVVALIGLAIFDCLTPCAKPRSDARRFVLGDELDFWCDLVGLNADFVRFVARRAGYLADENQHWHQVRIKATAATTPAIPTPQGERS